MAESKRKRPPRLHRRCPSCGVARPVSEYPRSMSGQGAGFGSGWRSRCPSCGREGLTMTFMRADPSADDEGGDD
jgi:ribosomal protein S14